MRINKLKINAFGKLKSIDLTLDDNITVIKGKNEAGKSTLCSFISYMLYGFSGQSKRSIAENDKKKFTPWESDFVSGELDFTTLDGKKYTAIRKTAARNESAILDDIGTVLYNSQNAGDLFLSVDSSVYRKTAFVAQNDITFSDEGDLERAINNIVSSGDENADAIDAFEKLTKSKKELMGIKSGSGEIGRIDTQLVVLQTEKAKWQNGHAELLSSESQLRDTNEKIASNKEKINALEREMFNLKCLDAAKKLTETQKLEQAANITKCKLDELRKTMQNGDFFPDDDYIYTLKGAYNNCVYAKNALKRAKDSADTAKQSYDSAYADDIQRSLSQKLSELGLSPTDAEGKINALQSKIKSALRLALIFTILIITLPVAIFFWVKQSKLKKELSGLCRELLCNDPKELLSRLSANGIYKNAASSLKNVLDKEISGFEKAKADFEEALNQLCGLLSKAGVSFDKPNCITAAYCHLAQLSDFKGIYDGIKQQHSDDLLRYNTFKNSFDIEEATKLSQQVDASIQPRPYDAVSRELKYCTMANENLYERQKELEKKAAVLSGSLPKPAELESEILSLKERREALSQRYDELSLAIEALQSASDILTSTLSPKISARAGELFSLLTSGKYRALQPDGNESLAFLQSSDATLRSAHYLSSGTRELAYIAYRLALSENLFKEPATLVFDDAFSNFDDERLEKMLDFLVSVSPKTQIVILSCHGREAKLLEGKAKIIDFKL